MPSESIPVTITEDAAAWIQERGLQRELEQMIEYAKQTTSNTIGFKVTAGLKEKWPESLRGILISVMRVAPAGSRPDMIEYQWIKWIMDNLPHVPSGMSMISWYVTSPEEAAA